MIEKIVLSLCYIVIFLFVTLSSISQILYVLQLNSYKSNSIYSHMFDVFKKHIIYWLLYIVIGVCFFLIKVVNFWALLLAVLLIGFVLILLGNNFKNIKKFVYTKRMIRLVLLAIILVIVECALIVRFIQINYAIILLPFCLFFSYVTVSIDYLILMPIEFAIGEYYINKAKQKLSGFKKLIKVGITGSFGKTSTKEILTTILREEFSVLPTPKSYNTPFGITKTINNELSGVHELFICEMGAKKRGEIKYLCELVKVDAGIVTSVGRQHTNTFGSIENVYKTKKELPDALFNKTCVFNLMNKYTMYMYKEFVGEKIGVFILNVRNKKINFVNIKKRIKKLKPIKLSKVNALHEYPIKFNYYAKSVKCDENGCNFNLYYNGEFIENISTVLIGRHNIINVLLSVAFAFRLGMSKHNVVLGVGKVKSIKARLEKNTLLNGAIVLNNGYNSNIDSAKFALETLGLFKNRSRKVVVTPGLIETENDYEYNEKFGRLIAKYCTDVVIVKEKNKGAILKGLLSAGFDMCNIATVPEFKDALKIINNADENYVFLIENDLPDNYK